MNFFLRLRHENLILAPQKIPFNLLDQPFSLDRPQLIFLDEFQGSQKVLQIHGEVVVVKVVEIQGFCHKIY